LAQTLAPREILVIDDGSSDATADLAVGEGGEAVRVLDGPARGVAAARNVGLRAARTVWVALLDSDDMWRPSLLQMVAERLREHPEAMACFVAADALDDDGQLIGRHPMPDGPIALKALVTGRVVPTTSATVIRRSAALTVGGFFEGFERRAGAEDLDLWFRLSAGGPCVGLSARLGVYVVHEFRDRARTKAELMALERDRERVIDRLADTSVSPRVARHARAVMRARTGRYWLLTGNSREARRCAFASLLARPTPEGAVTFVAALAPIAIREAARTARRYQRTRAGV
jgi:glycosyltransferase involved in cell wall biosynthesis